MAACKAINNLLACKATLKKLHLYNNMSDDEGAFAIANLIESTPNMEDFMMVSSRVKQEGGQRTRTCVFLSKAKTGLLD